MKLLVVLAFSACIFLSLGEDDGKYRPTEPTSTTILRTYQPTTTRIPVFKHDGWATRAAVNPGRYWPNDHYDPRYEPRAVDPRVVDPRVVDPRVVAPRYDPRVVDPRVDGRFNVGKPYVPRTYHDYRTIRLDEKVDAKGYRYVYETVGGIVAEEVGTFQTLGLPNEGVRTVGFVEITDPDGIAYRIDYQAVSKEAYITPRGEAPRTPPSIVKLLALLEAHK